MKRGNQNPIYRKIATRLEEEIRKGDIPVGAMLLSRAVAQRFSVSLSSETMSNVFVMLKYAGLVELRKAEGLVGKRYFVKTPESPQGGSPERR